MDDKAMLVIEEHIDIIDSYVKQLGDEHIEIKMKYASLLNSSIFKVHANFLTSVDAIYRQMFYIIDSFVNDALPIHMKAGYIKYYEKTLNKTWKQLYMSSSNIKVYDKTPTLEEIESRYGTTKWWVAEIKSFI